MIIAVIFIVIALWRKYIYLIPFLILGGLFIGLWRGSVLQNDLSQYKSLYGLTISIEDTVKDDADTGTADQIIIRLDKIVINKKSIVGVLWVSTANDDIRRGDKLIPSNY